MTDRNAYDDNYENLPLFANSAAVAEGLEAQNAAAEIKLRAERKAGEMLAAMEKQRPGEYQRSHDVTVAPTLEDLGIDKMQSSRWQREAKVSDEDFEQYVESCREEAKELTQAGLLNIAKGCHVSQATGENEWYTPPEYIELARQAMGGIDLDPASCKLAQVNVKAKQHYTIDDNGLTKKWRGRVWLNPPYSKELCGLFIEKLIEEASNEGVIQACVLVNNATDTSWCQKLLAIADAICLISGRVRFLDKTGKQANSPLQGQLVAYIGPRRADFVKLFSATGVCFGASLFANVGR